MAEVKMDLKELEAIKAEIQQAKDEKEQLRIEYEQKLDKIQAEKSELLANQKRVLFTKRSFEVKQYLPCTEQNIISLLENMPVSGIMVGWPTFNDEITKIIYRIKDYLLHNCTFEKHSETVTPLDKEEHYEFINLDEAINMALQQENSEYTKELRDLKEQNSRLVSRLADYDAETVKQKDKLVKEYEVEIKHIRETAKDRYDKLAKEADKKYKQLEESSAAKYKQMEQEFAKYRDDEEEMTLKDKLEKYQQENNDLRKDIAYLEKKLKSKGFFGFLKM